MLCLGKLLFLLFLLSDLDWRLVSVGNSKSSSSSTSLLLSFSDSFSVAASDSESFFCCWFVKENVYNKYEDLRTVALGGRLFVKTLPKILKNQPGPQPFAARSVLDSTVSCDVSLRAENGARENAEGLGCWKMLLNVWRVLSIGEERKWSAEFLKAVVRIVERSKIPGFLHLHLGFRLYKLVQCVLQNRWLPGTNGNWNMKPIELKKAGKKWHSPKIQDCANPVHRRKGQTNQSQSAIRTKNI